MEAMMEKLKILADSAKYDVSCSSSGVGRENDGKLGNVYASGICHSWGADGRCISLLKILFTNKCVYDCAYCVNRRSNDFPRASFEPEELARLTIEFYRRNYIEGLFLSSAVEVSPDYTAERILAALTLLRNQYGFAGYIHAKIFPGVSAEILHQIGLVADRLSVNIEMPTSKSLATFAPQKKPKQIFAPMRQITNSLIERNALIGPGTMFQGQKLNTAENYLSAQDVRKASETPGGNLSRKHPVQDARKPSPSLAGSAGKNDAKASAGSADKNDAKIFAGSGNGPAALNSRNSNGGSVAQNFRNQNGGYAGKKTAQGIAPASNGDFCQPPASFQATGLLSQAFSAQSGMMAEDALIYASGQGGIVRKGISPADQAFDDASRIIASGQGSQSGSLMKKDRKKERVAPSGQTTQMIIGAGGETDQSILTTSENLYRTFKMKRVYYSAYIPVVESPLLPALTAAPPLAREHRIYQADWLLRFYGFAVKELFNGSNPNLDPDLDPKVTWALRNLEQFPVEVNKASYGMLMRIPGIGAVSAKRIVRQRKVAAVRFDDLKKMGVVVKRAKYFLTCCGRYYGARRFEPESIKHSLLQMENGLQISMFDNNWNKLEEGARQEKLSEAGII